MSVEVGQWEKSGLATDQRLDCTANDILCDIGSDGLSHNEREWEIRCVGSAWARIQRLWLNLCKSTTTSLLTIRLSSTLFSHRSNERNHGTVFLRHINPSVISVSNDFARFRGYQALSPLIVSTQLPLRHLRRLNPFPGQIVPHADQHLLPHTDHSSVDEPH